MKKYSERIIQAFLLCRTNKEIAKEAGISERSVLRLKHDENFQKILRERQNEIIKAEINKMTALFSTCVDELQKIIEDPETKQQIKINAIQVLFNQCREWNVQADNAERLERIEMALSGGNWHT